MSLCSRLHCTAQSTCAEEKRAMVPGRVCVCSVLPKAQARHEHPSRTQHLCHDHHPCAHLIASSLCSRLPQQCNDDAAPLATLFSAQKASPAPFEMDLARALIWCLFSLIARFPLCLQETSHSMPESPCCQQLCHVLCLSLMRRTACLNSRRPKDSNETCHKCVRPTLHLLHNCSCKDGNAMFLGNS